METVAGAMASSVVHGALGAAKTAAAKIALQLSLEGKMGIVKDNLELLKAYLMDSRGPVARRVLARQVRDLEYDVEDCVEALDVHQGKPWWSYPLRIMDRYRIAAEMKMLRARVENATNWLKSTSEVVITSQRKDDATGVNSNPFRLVPDDAAVLSALWSKNPMSKKPAEASSSANYSKGVASTSSEIEEPENNLNFIVESLRDRNSTMLLPHVEEATPLVGRDKEMDWLHMKITNDGMDKNNVISVCGMRGIGKTALVRKAYHQDFFDSFTHRAWITVSSSLNKGDILCNVLQHFQPDYPNNNAYLRSPAQIHTAADLIKFYDMLKSANPLFRCLLVVDGLSTTMEWDLVSSSVFFKAYKSVLQIIVTTRNLEVAHYCSRYDFVYNLGRLFESDAAKLFHLKVFGTSTDVYLEPSMADQSTQVLDKCGGIPFAILHVGQHLASRPRTATEWQRSIDCLNLDLLEAKPGLQVMKAILESCYNSLPYQNKYCFLYLIVFQEVSNITRRRLVKRWIAEGYVTGSRGLEAEEIGERIIGDFLSRTIIQPTKYATITSGRVTSCSVHPLMLELSISKAIVEEKLVCMLDDRHNPEVSQGNIRHLVVRSSWRRHRVDEYKCMNLSHLRSLTVFGEWRPFFLSPSMQILRVLDLEGVIGLTGHDLMHIGHFLHLKYLSLRSTDVEYLPKSVGKLQRLETLDIRYTNVRTLPSTIIHLRRLRVLRGGFRSLQVHHARSGGDPWGMDVSTVIGELHALNTLGAISIAKQGHLVIRELERLTDLQRLSLTGITDTNGHNLCSALRHLSRLKSLTVHSDHPYGLSTSLQADSLPSLQDLQVLKLYGRLPILPLWISGLKNLFKLYLQNTRLGGTFDIMNVLALLPNLTTLLLLADSIVPPRLEFRRNPFQDHEIHGAAESQRRIRRNTFQDIELVEGTNFELTFKSVGFQELELLELSNLMSLKSFAFEDLAMPKLKILQIGGCNNLEILSFGCRAAPNLEILQVNGSHKLSQGVVSGVEGLERLSQCKF